MKELRPHQREAVDAVLRALEVPASGTVPERGLRTHVIMATGTGKTLVAARGAEELHTGRVLVLLPSLDLLAQTEAAWHEAGCAGLMIDMSSLRGEEAAFPNTTDVDEAHRASGRNGKPWAVVHDNTRIPSLRRLHMNATPRLCNLFLPLAWDSGTSPRRTQRRSTGSTASLPAKPVMPTTQATDIGSMRLSAKLGFTEVERFQADAEQWLGLRLPVSGLRTSP